MEMHWGDEAKRLTDQVAWLEQCIVEATLSKTKTVIM